MITDRKRRCWIYFEVSCISALWFGLMAGIALALSYALPKLFESWAGAVLLFALAVLPYLVISSLVWEVPLGVMGAKAGRATVDKAKEPSEVIE